MSINCNKKDQQMSLKLTYFKNNLQVLEHNV